MFYCPKVSISAIFEKRVTDGPTDGRTDPRTDKASYRDAWTHLKTVGGGEKTVSSFRNGLERGSMYQRKLVDKCAVVNNCVMFLFLKRKFGVQIFGNALRRCEKVIDQSSIIDRSSISHRSFK